MNLTSKFFPVIVIGGGHAGVEAALASARLKVQTLLITLDKNTIAALSCNPAFGGPAKGGLIREVDALGGIMGWAADQAAIQCKTLGESRGPAARSTRLQVDRLVYQKTIQKILENQSCLEIIEGEGAEILKNNNSIQGIKLACGQVFNCHSLVLAGGTFFRAVIFHGKKATPAGRINEAPANLISLSLEKIGHSLARLTTNTPPRLKADTVDFSDLCPQEGQDDTEPFSVLSPNKVTNSHLCYLTYTNEITHQIVAENIETSAAYSGLAHGAGPRYCPSIEDKVKRFPERKRHQVFIEPDGQNWLFPNGLTTGLEPQVQIKMINSIKGMEKAVIARPGYAIEYDYINPIELTLTLESKLCLGLFLAGQINGTSGYEEAAAQGLIAGANAALNFLKKNPLILKRDQALIGVMIDDLTTQGITEPYRIFTSRAEWRLLLREDNADLRLSPLAEDFGLLDKRRSDLWRLKKQEIKQGLEILQQRFSPQELKSLLEKYQAGNTPKGGLSLHELLKRPQINLNILESLAPKLEELSPKSKRTLETEVKFAGYLNRQKLQVAKLAQTENIKIPPNFTYTKLSGLSNEAIEKLTAFKPTTLGQASRLSGITPAAISVLSIYLIKK